jgi:hypothetical protein
MDATLAANVMHGDYVRVVQLSSGKGFVLEALQLA